jgi:hypothetical protein
MTSYRLYSVDVAGKIIGAQWLDASSDIEAIDLAKGLNMASNCELWNHTKFVQSIEAAVATIAGSPTVRPMSG